MSMLVTPRPPRHRDDAHWQRDERSFLLQRAQPAMTGRIEPITPRVMQRS